MKYTTAALLIILALLLSCAAVLFTTAFVQGGLFQEKKFLAYEVTVGNVTGFDVARDKVRLGSLTPGSSSYRDVTVSHPSSEYFVAQIIGEGRSFVYPENNPTYLVNGSGVVRIRAHPTSQTSHGVYEGKIRIIFYP